MRSSILALLAILVILITAVPATAEAQGLATLCVGVYLDANGNGQRDADESGLPDVNLSLSVPPGVIVTNYVTENSAPHCFEALPSGVEYTLLINSPDFTPATADPIVFTPQPQDQIAQEFPLVVRLPEEPNNEAFRIPLDMRSRLILASLCAVVSMAFIGAVGLLIYGVFLYPRKKRSAEQGKQETLTMSRVNLNKDRIYPSD
ncbi:MAG: hypothetical protein KF726_24260 [Anaerolineae bacterium]|nr:hypothetical protein [Anaerolineae bacterium]